MPGLVGFAILHSKRMMNPIGQVDPKKVLYKMQDLITHEDFYKRDELFYDGYLGATRSHINIIQKESQPYCRDGIYIWLDGEFYNREEISRRHRITAKTDLELLHVLFRQESTFSFLKGIDGIFSAIVYDSLQQKVYLIADRYGLRHLYWTVYRGCLAWSTEIKAITAIPGFEPKVDHRAMKEFLGIGYMLENRTWFEQIELLPSGTVLAWDIKNGDICSKHRYWWWDEIKPMTGKINEDDVARELGRLLVDAVERRCYRGDRVGLTLSGGLDSRALLAAMPDQGNQIHAVTFGRAGCDDVRIAALAAKVKGAVHHNIELNSTNWLMPRLAGIWWTDGQLSLMHMHGIEARSMIRNIFQVNLNGFAGDLILGGSYLKDRRFLSVNNDRNLIASIMDCDPSLIENFPQYSPLGKFDFYFLQNRVRRFTFCGTKHWLTSVEQRKPFYDNKLIELVYSLPDAMRFNSHIYRLMLLKTFPDFYQRIPWQRTGVPISRSASMVEAVTLLRKTRNKVQRKLSSLGIQCNNLINYTDYPNWLRQEPARSFFDKVLNSPSAIYPAYISKEQVYDKLARHQHGEDHAEMLCRYATFEIWLQQIYENHHRPGNEAICELTAC
ncbi:MAG: asparagine synthase-related protein [bacterium]